MQPALTRFVGPILTAVGIGLAILVMYGMGVFDEEPQSTATPTAPPVATSIAQ